MNRRASVPVLRFGFRCWVRCLFLTPLGFCVIHEHRRVRGCVLRASLVDGSGLGSIP